MSLPIVERLTAPQRAFAALSIITSTVLFALNARAVVTEVPFAWWVPCALVLGMAAADFLSGLVHWAADTWGRDDTPIVGPRLLVPFRVHHVNPDDFLERPFLDTNGEVAFLSIPVLIAALFISHDTVWESALAVARLGFCAVGMMTNQIHQWAHMATAPQPVRLLQECGLILGHDAHQRHHGRPYDASYCIATGWCNRALDRIQLFKRLERIIAWCSGAEPRLDEARYLARVESDVSASGQSIG